LAERGLEVLGIDPDERMAEVARRHGLTVEVARFEEWDPAGRTFDRVVSGQAWHWVDSRIGPAKAADVLAPGGSLAVFWNRPGYDPVIGTRLDEVYQPRTGQQPPCSSAPRTSNHSKRPQRYSETPTR
jgi:SAM-dependent methyltransferase